MNDAERLRDEGIARADRAADESWKKAAAWAVTSVARSHGEFTTDDVWKVLDDAGITVREPRAIAAILKRAVGGGMIEPTGVRRNSKLPRGHARPVMIYRSRLTRS